MKPELFEHYRLTVQTENTDPKTKASRPWNEVCRTYLLHEPDFRVWKDFETTPLMFETTESRIRYPGLIGQRFHFELLNRWPSAVRRQWWGEIIHYHPLYVRVEIGTFTSEIKTEEPEPTT